MNYLQHSSMGLRILLCLLQSGVCFLLVIRENVVQYRTDALSLAMAGILGLIVSIGTILSMFSSLKKRTVLLAILHLPALLFVPILYMVGNPCFGIMSLLLNSWNIFGLLSLNKKDFA